MGRALFVLIQIDNNIGLLMLSLQHPEVIDQIKSVSPGIYTLQRGENELILVIKHFKEGILAAKLKRKIPISFVPYTYAEHSGYALYLLLEDNAAEPLVIFSTLFDNDESSKIFPALKQNRFELYFFDEHGREFLGYRAGISDWERLEKNFHSFKFPPPSIEEGKFLYENHLDLFFSVEGSNSKHEFEIVFHEALYDENLYFIDAANNSKALEKNGKIVDYQLHRPEPGAAQELDIFLLLENIFPTAELFLNPMKREDGLELLDVLVVTDDFALFVQAKDSPNTEKILATSIKRKKLKSIAHLEKAITQFKGAVNFAKRNPKLALSVNSTNLDLFLAGKRIYGLVILKEIFDDDMTQYTKIVLGVANQIDTPCVVMDYPELHHYSQHVKENQFIECLLDIFNRGKQLGIFPRKKFVGRA